MIVALMLAALQCPAGAQPRTGELGEEQCFDKDGKQHGPEVSGQVRRAWSHGEKVSETALYENGKVQAERRWANGKPTGTWDRNYEDGKPAWRRTYSGGVVVKEQLFSRDGKPVAPAKKLPDGGTEGGGLSKDVLMLVIKSHQNEVKFCYEVELQRVPNLLGNLGTHFVIDPDGHVNTADVTENTFPGDAVSKCVVERIKKWEVPRPIGGGIVEVNFPWVFKPAEP